LKNLNSVNLSQKNLLSVQHYNCLRTAGLLCLALFSINSKYWVHGYEKKFAKHHEQEGRNTSLGESYWASSTVSSQ